MLFKPAIDQVISARSGRRPGADADVSQADPTHSSILHLDFTRGETHKAMVFSGPVSAFPTYEHFVAYGIDTILKELGYDHTVWPEDDEAIDQLSKLRFEPVREPKTRRLNEHVFHPDIEHDLSYYDHPKVTPLACMPSWIFPASGGLLLTSVEMHFFYYWYCTG